MCSRARLGTMASRWRIFVEITVESTRLCEKCRSSPSSPYHRSLSSRGCKANKVEKGAGGRSRRCSRFHRPPLPLRVLSLPLSLSLFVFFCFSHSYFLLTALPRHNPVPLGHIGVDAFRAPTYLKGTCFPRQTVKGVSIVLRLSARLVNKAGRE